MKKLCVIFLVLFCSAITYAEPYLVCDAQENVDQSVLVINDGSELITPAPLHYDLSQLDVGGYVVVAYAEQDSWRSPVSVPFEFTKPLLRSPIGMKLTRE